MSKERELNVYDTISSVTFFSKFMAVHPPTTIIENNIQKGQSKIFYRFCLTSIYSLIYTMCLIVAYFEKSILISDTYYNFNRLAYLLYAAMVISEIISAYVQYISTMYATPYAIYMLEMTRKIDLLIKKTGYKFNYKIAFLISLIIITSGMYFIAFNIFLEVWNAPRENIGNHTIYSVVITCWPHFLMHMAESQFILVNLMMFTRFFAINYVLEMLFKARGGKDYLIEPESFLMKSYRFKLNSEMSDEYLIYCTMKSHYYLYRTSIICNNLYGMIMTLSAFIQFSTIAFAMCFCYYKIATTPIATLAWLLWALLRIYELVRKTYIVHLVMGESKKTVYFINKLLMLEWNEKIKNKLQVFLLQLDHCQVRYTGCGLFDIDGTLVFTVVASATMFIIVTYQFEQGLTDNCKNITSTSNLSDSMFGVTIPDNN